MWLPLGIVLGSVGGLMAIIFRLPSLIVLALAVMISYGQILHIAKKADELTASRGETIIQIEQIIKQQGDYQTAVATDSNGIRLFLNWQAKTPLQLAKRYQVELRRRPISSRLNRGNFNGQKRYFSQGIVQLATVKRATMIVDNSKHLRSDWLASVFQQTKNLPAQGLLLALAFGERGWLAQGDWQVFQQTATAHLIAISGLHIALAFGFGLGVGKGVLWVVWRFRRGKAVRFSPFFTLLSGYLFAIGYSYLAGFAVPTLRALVAISLILSLKMARRHYTAWQYWWRTVALLLLFEPMSLLSDSFWLSILAVASLILWYQFFPLSQFLPENGKKERRFTRLLGGGR